MVKEFKEFSPASSEFSRALQELTYESPEDQIKEAFIKWSEQV